MEAYLEKKKVFERFPPKENTLLTPHVKPRLGRSTLGNLLDSGRLGKTKSIKMPLLATVAQLFVKMFAPCLGGNFMTQKISILVVLGSHLIQCSMGFLKEIPDFAGIFAFKSFFFKFFHPRLLFCLGLSLLAVALGTFLAVPNGSEAPSMDQEILEAAEGRELGKNELYVA